MKSAELCLLFISLLFMSDGAQAWNKAGHMVTGAVAALELRSANPQSFARVITLLKKHPQFESLFKDPINATDDPNLALFMRAARWADDIRGTDLSCELCHFINFPFKPTGQPASVSVLDPDPQNILAAFNEKVAIFRNGGSSDPDKAMALTWIFHLVGDVHQPLHTARLFTTLFPQGDRGGTRFFVKVDEERGTISLHRFWDDLILHTDRFQSVSNRATELRNRADLTRSALPELSEKKFENWAKMESFEAAKEHAYRFGTLEGSTDDSDGSLLPEDYSDTTKPIAERRAMLAGYRLADLLHDLFR
jgi:S1/P1 Nuclease